MIDAYGNLRLGDFGWSIKSTGRRKTLCGTPEVFSLRFFCAYFNLLQSKHYHICFKYIPPEMIDKKEYDYRVGKS